MNIFEYVVTINAIVLGVGIARLLDGVGRFIAGVDKPKAYWLHLLWVLYTFLYVVFFWWWEFRLGSVSPWTFQLYLFFIFYAVVLYLLCVLLFPSGASDFFKQHFASRQWFFGLWTLVRLIDILDSRLKGSEYFASLGPGYWIYSTVNIVIFAVLWRSTNERLHVAGGIVALTYQLFWMFSRYDTV